MPLSPGERVDRYQIAAFLGRGGMGEVYSARDSKLERQVALKMMRLDKDLAASGPLLLREARAAATLSHPNVLAVYDVGEVAEPERLRGHAYIAMELVVGRSLRTYVGDETVPVETRVGWLRDVARALAAAHEAGVVHRDVKPENVMIRIDGMVKVLDFGIARRTSVAVSQNWSAAMHSTPTIDPRSAEALASTLGAHETGGVAGTLLYMAPEQLRGEAIDNRTDQFAWGVLAYELLTGRVPWGTDPTPIAVISMILSSTPRPLDDIDPRIPRNVAEAVMRALAKAPGDRFESMEKLLSAQEGAATAPLNESARLGGSTPRIGERSGRWTSWAVGLGVAATVAGALVARELQRDRARGPKPASVTAVDPSAPLAIEDVQASPTKSPEALAGFHASMRAWGRGRTHEAVVKIEEALRLDPAFASAHLQRAVFDMTMASDVSFEGRGHMANAASHREQLSPRDRDLLDALEPGVLDPPNWVEEERRLRSFVAGRPGDAEAWDVLGCVQSKGFEAREAIESFVKEAAADPHGTRGHDVRAQNQASVGDLAGARATRRECLVREPRSVSCRLDELDDLSLAGKCDQVEDGARELAAIVPDSPEGYRARAKNGPREGASEAAIALLFEQARARLPPDERAEAEASDVETLATLRGDFAAALSSLDQLDRLSREATVSLQAIVERGAILEETGDLAGAGAIAARGLEQTAALRYPEHAYYDPTPGLLVLAQRSGKMPASEFERRRQAWVAASKSKLIPEAWGLVAFGIWSRAYGDTSTEAEARGSVSQLAQFADLPPPGAHLTEETEATTGATLLRAGRLNEALPRLESAAGRCTIDRTVIRAHLPLGEARELAGDASGACDAYSFVLSHWGHAKPRSVTADEARARAKKLRCAAVP